MVCIVGILENIPGLKKICTYDIHAQYIEDITCLLHYTGWEKMF